MLSIVEKPGVGIGYVNAVGSRVFSLQRSESLYGAQMVTSSFQDITGYSKYVGCCRQVQHGYEGSEPEHKVQMFARHPSLKDVSLSPPLVPAT